MRTKRIFTMAFLVFAALFFVAGGTLQAVAAPNQPAAGEIKGPIKIGFIGRLSAPWGLSNKTSLEISVDDLNAKGGILGRPVQMIVEDSKGEIPLVVAAYKKLVMTDRCALVVVESTEPIFSCMELGAELYKQYPHIMFGVFVSHDEPTYMVCANYEKYKFFFRPFEKGGSHYDPNIKEWEVWTKVIGTKKLAFMAEDMAFTKPLVEGIPGKTPPLAEFFRSKGLDVVYTGQNSIKEKMFLPILEEIAAKGADTIYWITAYTDTVTLAKQWAQSAARDIDMVTMAGAPCYAAFWNMTGGAALGWVTLDPEISVPYTARTLPFLAKLKAKGAGMMNSTYPSYDSPWIFKAAAEHAKTASNADAIIKALETIQVQGISWVWKFNKCHDPITGYPPYMPYHWGQFQENGKLVSIFPPGIAKLVNPKSGFVRVKDLRARAAK
ncbi:MAG: ABC transporter substrate-binding protein [Thermodesulfobacteriota bacterium]